MLAFTTPIVTTSQLGVETVAGTVVALEVSFAVDGQHYHEVIVEATTLE